MPVLLAIDANIFLRFFEYSKDSLVQLEKLSAAIKHSHIRLFVTSQVRLEVNIRRHEIVKRSLKELESKKAPDNFPRIADPYNEYSEMRTAGAAFNKSLNDLLKKITGDAQKGELAADKVLTNIFESAANLDWDPATMSAAELRLKVGKPPGKGKLGDAITWETLLRHAQVPAGSKFFFVTDDSDYINPLSSEVLPVLRDEWAQRKKGEIVLYTSLGKFFSDNFPEIEIADELEKLSAINELIYSGSFFTTHKAIAVLSQFKAFTTNEVKKMVDALLNNSQVRWIATDEDVETFYKSLVAGKENILDSDVLKEFEKLYIAPEAPMDDFPF